MRVDVVTLFPGMVEILAEYGITGRAARSGILELKTWNPRDYARDRHRTVDDRPYGGGPGMVMMYEPLVAAIRDAHRAAPGAPVLCLSPQGRRLEQADVQRLARREALILVAGRYEGIDERVLVREVDEEWSIGDYVLSGGELPAMVLIDALTRLQPGALGDADSAVQDSFTQGILDCPHYTRPPLVEGLAVPEVLLGGHHGEIARWRLKQALGRTWERRPDLLRRLRLDAAQQALLEEYIQETGDRSAADTADRQE